MQELEQIITLVSGLGEGAKQAFVAYLLYKVVYSLLWAVTLTFLGLKVIALIRYGINQTDPAREATRELYELFRREPEDHYSGRNFQIERTVGRIRSLKKEFDIAAEVARRKN